ncbi:hypothetical protein PENSPDRAFT_756775 [Peniophora sp. CONT]|nr:hypothetical protein PENSPDRAFT_756775 [Peniophora sp. CONT]
MERLLSAGRELRTELQRRHKQITAVVNSFHNNALSVNHGLLPDILPQVIEEVAKSSPPSPRDLGWMKTSHVCSAWRQTIICMASLWAREAGVFRSLKSFRTITQRARGAPLTLRSIGGRFPGIFGSRHQDRLQNIYFEVLPRVRVIDLQLGVRDIERLLEALSGAQAPLKLETVILENLHPEEPRSASFPNPLNCPRLHVLSLQKVFVSSSGHKLTRLSLRGDSGYAPPISGTQFLDLLSGSSQELEELHLFQWLPATWEISPNQKVGLPCLRVMILFAPPAHAHYMSLLKHLGTPALASLCMDNTRGPQTLPDMLNVMDHVLSNGQQCFSNPDTLGIAFHRTGALSETHIVVHMGSHEDPHFTKYSPAFFSSPRHARQSTVFERSGVELRFSDLVDNVDDGIEPLEPTDAYQAIVERYVPWRAQSGLDPVTVASFTSTQLLSMDTRDTLSNLSAVETLYIHLPPGADTHSPSVDTDIGVLKALTALQPDGSFSRLPLLQNLIYKQEVLDGAFGNVKSERTSDGVSRT